MSQGLSILYKEFNFLSEAVLRYTHASFPKFSSPVNTLTLLASQVYATYVFAWKVSSDESDRDPQTHLDHSTCFIIYSWVGIA